MQSEQSLREYIDRFVVADEPLETSRAGWRARFTSDDQAFQRRATKAWLAHGATYKAARHWGKFRRTLALASCVLGERAVREIELAGLLLPQSAPLQEIARCLRDLERQLAGADDDGRRLLFARISTYRSYAELSSLTEDRGYSAKAYLAERPFRFGRTLLALSNLYFLREHFAFEIGNEFAALLAEHETPERLAAAVSTVIALANECRPLDSLDFTFPVEGIDVSEDLVSLLRYGAAKSALKEVGKLISSLHYKLTVSRSSTPRVYHLRAPSEDIEYALRLGFVRGEIGTTTMSIGPRGNEDERLPSILAGAEDLLRRLPGLIEVKDPGTPRRRLTLNAPSVPQLWDTISRIRFHEDALREDRLRQELELPMRRERSGDWMLVPGVDLTLFLRVWRCLEFLAVVDITALRRHQSDPDLIYNSLTRVSLDEHLAAMLTTVGVSSEHVPAFLTLIAAHVERLGHFDIQYKLFLRTNPATVRLSNGEKTGPPEVFHAPGIVATANVIPNVQRANGIRVKTNAEAFVAAVAETLRASFANVRTNVPVRLGKDSTDIDVLLLTEGTLFVIECKHSITPTGAHELRDLWLDVQHGVQQLQKAIRILSTRLHSHLAGQFPGTRKAQAERLRVQPCVLCSHRVFSGLVIDGIPIRDWASFALICRDAVMGMGESRGSGEVIMQRFRLRDHEQVEEGDLNEYFSETSRFFETFRPFMSPYDRLHRLFGGSIVLASSTYVHTSSQEEWVAHLESIGCVPLGEERVLIRPPAPIPPIKDAPVDG
jgi:hypothetical protein